MPLYNNFQAMSLTSTPLVPQKQKRLWRQKIKEEWDWECAYCGSEKKSHDRSHRSKSKGWNRLH